MIITKKEALITLTAVSVLAVSLFIFASSALAMERDSGEVVHTREVQAEVVEVRDTSTTPETTSIRPISNDEVTTTDRDTAVSSDCPVSCWDGSCVRLESECPAPREVTTRDDQTRPEAREESVSSNNQVERAELSTPDYLDVDDDNDSIPTMMESPAAVSDEARTQDTRRATPLEADQRIPGTDLRPSTAATTESDTDIEDIDLDDDEDDITPPPAQDYNSTRSNKRENSFDDGPDSDLIDRVRIDAREGRLIVNQSESSTTREEAGRIDPDLYCWGRAEDTQGREHQFGRGLCVASEVVADSSNLEEASRRVYAMQLRAQEIRSWSEGERQAWREYRENTPSNNHLERFADRAISLIEQDEAIEKLTIEDDRVFLDYQAEFRVLGLFPVRRSVRISNDIEGNLERRLPWFRFFSTQPNRTRMNEILQDSMQILVRVSESSN